MTFKELFPSFIAGTPIKRKVWRGYWKYNARIRQVVIYTKDGMVVPFEEVGDWAFTLSGILQDDWEVATNENCDIEVE
jgi:hypothetical protein